MSWKNTEGKKYDCRIRDGAACVGALHTTLKVGCGRASGFCYLHMLLGQGATPPHPLSSITMCIYREEPDGNDLPPRSVAAVPAGVQQTQQVSGMAHTSRHFGLGFSCPDMQPFSHLISLWAVHQSAVCRQAHQHPMLHCTAHARRCPCAIKGTERRGGTKTLPCSHWVGEEKPSVGARLPAALQSFISCFILHASWIYLFHYYFFF